MSNKFFDFLNKKSGSNRIFSREDVGALNVGEFSKLKDTLAEQVQKIGIPSDKELSNSDDVIRVSAYTKDDGTHVKAHWRSKPHGSMGIKQEETLKKGTFLPENVNELYNNLPNKKETATGAAANLETKKDETFPYMEPDKMWKLREKAYDIKEVGKKTANASFKVPQEAFHNAVNRKLNKNYKDAELLMRVFSTGTKNVDLSKEANLIDRRMNYSLAKTYKVPVQPGWQGLSFKPDSSLSNALNNSTKLKNILVDNFENGKKLTMFTVKIDDSTNLFRAINGATLYNLKDEGDYYTGNLFDNYDYKLNLDKYLTNDLVGSFANNYATLMQFTTGENFYIIVPIKIKK